MDGYSDAEPLEGAQIWGSKRISLSYQGQRSAGTPYKRPPDLPLLQWFACDAGRGGSIWYPAIEGKLAFPAVNPPQFSCGAGTSVCQRAAPPRPRPCQPLFPRPPPHPPMAGVQRLLPVLPTQPLRSKPPRANISTEEENRKWKRDDRGPVGAPGRRARVVVPVVLAQHKRPSATLSPAAALLNASRLRTSSAKSPGCGTRADLEKKPPPAVCQRRPQPR